jgi:hypothetical protein
MRSLYSDTNTTGITVLDEIILELDDYIQETKYYQRCVSGLLNRSKEVATLVTTPVYHLGIRLLIVASIALYDARISHGQVDPGNCPARRIRDQDHAKGLQQHQSANNCCDTIFTCVASCRMPPV